MSHEINAKIAGVFMYPEGKQPLKDMKAGDAFAFHPEPENQHDPNAIALLIGSVKVGYVPRAWAALLQSKTILSIQKTETWDGIKITFE